MKWETVIGLEVHTQLKTQSKLFSGAATAFGAAANTQTSYIDAGLPGVLPVVNEQAIVMAIRFGVAINAEINNFSYFERKNYFYPDLPKGYQISQFQRPIVSNGSLEIYLQNNNNNKIINITRAHLEEDAGKSLHDIDNIHTGIDLNRAGTPLLEIVTAPCMYSAQEAVTYLKTLHELVRFIDICDGNMQEGSFRCDVNLSLRPHGEKKLGTRTELKNLNSFRFIEKAIAYEEERHREILENGGTIHQETRLFSPDTESTYVMRSKENENDYRYFPDPDLLPIEITAETLAKVKANMPKLPREIRIELNTAGVHKDDLELLLSDPELLKYFNTIQTNCEADPKLIINWLKGPYLTALKEQNLNFTNNLISPKLFAEFIQLIFKQKINTTVARKIFAGILQGKTDLNLLLQENQDQLDLSSIKNLVEEIINKYPNQKAEFLSGKEKLLGFFVGQVMKELKGQGDPGEINKIIREILNNK